MLIPETYRRFEKEKGRSLREIGVANVAFTRENVLEALELLRGSQVAVLGGDVLEIVNGKPQYVYANWHSDPRAGENLMNYLRRGIAEAERYIRRYPDPEDGRILYSLSISELGVGSTARS
jgi:hypothetical protein